MVDEVSRLLHSPLVHTLTLAVRQHEVDCTVPVSVRPEGYCFPYEWLICRYSDHWPDAIDVGKAAGVASCNSGVSRALWLGAPWPIGRDMQ